MKYRRGDYKYIVAEDFSYETGIVNTGHSLPFCDITIKGLLTVRKGYASDGPSGPTIDTKSFMRGAFVHDALYQLLRETKFGQGHDSHDIRRHQADQALRNICLDDGMWKWRARWVYRAVRVGAGPSGAQKKRKVYTAP